MKNKLKHIIKYEALHILVIGILSFIITGSIIDSALIALLEPPIMMIIHYLMEE